MSPTQKDCCADLESLRSNWRSPVGSPCENPESDSWASDAEGSDHSESRKNSSYYNEDEEYQPLESYLDSGFEDSGSFQIASSQGKSEEIRSRAIEKKIQSILRSEPQVFKVYDKKERKKKKHAVSTEPRKSVGFIFPEGIKIPERVSHKRSRTPIRHLKVLRRKLGGKDSVPWRQSAHTLGKSKPLNPRVIKVDEGARRGDQLVIIKSATLGDLKLKKVKPSDLEDEDGSDYEQEDLFDGSNSDLDDVDSKSEDSGDGDEKELLQDVEEEDEDLIITRRKALRYHLKSIQLSNQTPKKPLKRTPSFPTAGHGVGHARRHYPHAPTHHNHLPHFGPTFKKDDDDDNDIKVDARNVPSIVVSAPEDVLSLDADSVSSMNPAPETAGVKQKYRRSSSVGSMDRVLFGIARLFESNAPEPRATPGKIIRTRYRRLYEEEVFPSIE